MNNLENKCMSTHGNQIITLFVSLILSIPAMANTTAQEKIFKEIFQYEINNRAFARKSIPQIAEMMKDTEQEVFWRAFSRLEDLSRPGYEKMAEKHGLAVNTLLVNLKTWSINMAMRVFPGKMMSTMADATEEYLEKLKKLPGLAKPEDREFFDYVVAQEETQLRGIQLLLQGKYAEAAEVINDFVNEQDALPSDN